MKIPVSASISPLSTDIEPEARYDALQVDATINRCVNAVTESLKCPSSVFTDAQRAHLSQIFLSMRHVHRGIRHMLLSDGQDPVAVSVMPIVRAQVETLFSICLIVEQPAAIDLYLKDGWKKLYVRHLLMREECQALDRVRVGLEMVAASIEGFRVASGVTEAEKFTVNHEELGTPIPFGGTEQRIAQFPAPKTIIRTIRDRNRQRMLVRLYPEYQFLCGFTHFSPPTMLLSTILDQRRPETQMFTSSQVQEIFQKEIAGPALWLDQLSVAQSCCEVLTIYPGDIELARACADAYRALCEQCLIGRVVWQLRARQLLGVLP